MPITRIMYEGVMKVARANPGVLVDLDKSNRHEVHLYDRRKKKSWKIDNVGKVHRT